jgi:hypothetical protein
MKVGDKYEDGIIVEYDEIAGKGVLFYEGVLAGGRFPTEKELNYIYSLEYIDNQHRYAILPKFFGKEYHTFGKTSKKEYDRLPVSFVGLKDFTHYDKVYCDECVYCNGCELCGKLKEKLTPDSPISRKTFEHEWCTTKNRYNNCKDYSPIPVKINMFKKIYNWFHTPHI